MNAAPVWDRKLRKDRKSMSGRNTYRDREKNKEQLWPWISHDRVSKNLFQLFLAQNIRRLFLFGGLKIFFFPLPSYNQPESLSDEISCNYSSYSQLRWPSAPSRCSWRTPWFSGGAVENTISAWSTAPCSSCLLAPTGTSTALLLQGSRLGGVHIIASSSRGHVFV